MEETFLSITLQGLDCIMLESSIGCCGTVFRLFIFIDDDNVNVSNNVFDIVKPLLSMLLFKSILMLTLRLSSSSEALPVG